MDRFRSMVEGQSEQEVHIDEAKLREFLSKVKVWDYVKISYNDYQKLSVADRSSIFKDYYHDMCRKFGSGKHLLFVLSDSGSGFDSVFFRLFLPGFWT